MSSSRDLLRHAVAVVAYRGGKAIHGAPATFADFKTGPTTRTPVRVLAHINDLYDWALSLAKGHESWRDSTPGVWSAEIERFFIALKAFDNHLASAAPIAMNAEQLLAGPVADSLTHIGQLAMLRRLSGSPIKGENYSKADIVAGRLGPVQGASVTEFD